MKKEKRKFMGSMTRYVMAFICITSWVAFGVVLALTSANISINGKISFTATDIYADVTGTVTGTATTNTLEDIHLTADTTSFTTPSSWSNINFDFVKGQDIVFTIKVTNKSTERPIWITFTDNITSTNTTITRKSAGTTVTKFDILEVPKSTTKSVEITLHLSDATKSASGNFDLGLKLDNNVPVTDKTDITYTVTDGKAVISGYTGTQSFFSVPETIDGYSTSLQAGSSSGAGVTLPSTVTTLIIPGTIDKISECAFRGNGNLTSIILGEGIGCIGVRAFYDCIKVSEITIPKSVTRIEVGAFHYCIGLTTVTFEEGSQLSLLYGFDYCSGLTSITIPSSVTSIGKEAFTSCSKLSFATFENPNGWKAGDTALSSSDLANTSTAATYLRSTYVNLAWGRS